MKYNIEQFRTALLTDKVNNYYSRFTDEEWEDILSLAIEKFYDEDYEVDLWEANNDAYQQGIEEGYKEGRHDGYDDGYGNGYDAGYVDGLVYARNEKCEDGV